MNMKLLLVLLIFGQIEALALYTSTKRSLPTAQLTVRKSSQLANFLAGGVAGTLAAVLTTPLEIIKTQLQASKTSEDGNTIMSVTAKIFEKEGASGFVKGISPMLLGIIPSRALYFWSYTAAKDRLVPFLGDSPNCHVVSALGAGIFSNTLTNPMWMIKTRYQLLADGDAGHVSFSSYKDVVEDIYKKEGLGGFFKGLSASYIGCLEGGIQWAVYEQLKHLLLQRKRRDIAYSPQAKMTHSSFTPNSQNQDLNLLSTTRLFPRNGWLGFMQTRRNADCTTSQRLPAVSATKRSAEVIEPTCTPLECCLAASTAKCLAICATYPHEVIRTRLREQATNGVYRYTGFANSFLTIAREEGLGGLYGGIGMHLLRSVPNAAIMFVTFEYVNQWLANHGLNDTTISPSKR